MIPTNSAHHVYSTGPSSFPRQVWRALRSHEQWRLPMGCRRVKVLAATGNDPNPKSKVKFEGLYKQKQLPVFHNLEIFGVYTPLNTKLCKAANTSKYWKPGYNKSIIKDHIKSNVISNHFVAWAPHWLPAIAWGKGAAHPELPRRGEWRCLCLAELTWMEHPVGHLQSYRTTLVRRGMFRIF